MPLHELWCTVQAFIDYAESSLQVRQRRLILFPSADSYVRLYTFTIPEDAFDFEPVEGSGNSHPTKILRLTWGSARIGSSEDPKQGGSRFLWKVGHSEGLSSIQCLAEYPGQGPHPYSLAALTDFTGAQW
jgi:hypothetical protein